MVEQDTKVWINKFTCPCCQSIITTKMICPYCDTQFTRELFDNYAKEKGHYPCYCSECGRRVRWPIPEKTINEIVEEEYRSEHGWNDYNDYIQHGAL